MPTFLCAVKFNKTCFKTFVWCLGSRNPLKGLQFVSSDTRERLRYSDVNLPYFSICPKTFKTSQLRKFLSEWLFSVSRACDYVKTFVCSLLDSLQNKKIVHNFARLAFVYVVMNQISITAFQTRHNKHFKEMFKSQNDVLSKEHRRLYF